MLLSIRPDVVCILKCPCVHWAGWGENSILGWVWVAVAAVFQSYSLVCNKFFATAGQGDDCDAGGGGCCGGRAGLGTSCWMIRRLQLIHPKHMRVYSQSGAT